MFTFVEITCSLYIEWFVYSSLHCPNGGATFVRNIVATDIVATLKYASKPLWRTYLRVRFAPYISYKRCVGQQKQNVNLESSSKVSRQMPEMSFYSKAVHDAMWSFQNLQVHARLF